MTASANGKVHSRTNDHRGTIQDRIVPDLVAAGTITKEAADQAYRTASTNLGGHGWVYYLVEQKAITPQELGAALHATFKEEFVDLTKYRPDPRIIRMIPANVAHELNVLPLKLTPSGLRVAMIDPVNLQTIARLQDLTKGDIEPRIADEYSLVKAIRAAYASDTHLQDHVMLATSTLDEMTPTVAAAHEVDEVVERHKIPELVKRVLLDATRRRASDIHFEFYESSGRIRYRLDGHLVEIMVGLDRRLGPAVVRRVKILAELDTAQDRIPLDGTMSLEVDGQRVDYRVSTLPTTAGETVVLRVLEREALFHRIEDLGMLPRDEAAFSAALRKNEGMVLATGPTGCGKSTTLYTALSILNSPHRKILTIEDPVERRLDGVTQVHVQPHENPRLDLSYATALRAFLRQDPNVIMVGEIRDQETAVIAIRAAITGHLMLSTLHTLDTASTLARLLDLGVEPFNVATCLHMVIAQRLVRRICDHCREPYTPTPRELRESGFSPKDLDGIHFFRGKGCTDCSQTGYQGRIGVFEVMPISHAMKIAIGTRKPAHELHEIAVAEGMTPLRVAGLQRLREGVTTLSEVVHETNI